MDKRSKFPDPWEGILSSDRDKRWITILGDENELVPWKGPVIWSIKEKRQQLKYVGKEITHTPGTLRAIPYGVLNRRDKLTSRNLSIHSEAVDKIYLAHTNSLRKAGLSPPVFPTMGDLWRK